MARTALLYSVYFRLLFFTVVFTFVLTGCSSKESPEDQIRQYIASAVSAAESREALAIRKLISENYKDEGRRDRRKLVGLAVGYFLRHKNIHLFTQISEIKFPVPSQSPKEAQVKLYAAMAGSPVTGAQALLDIRADLYQFDLTLIRDGNEWLLKKSSWQRSSIDELIGGG